MLFQNLIYFRQGTGIQIKPHSKKENRKQIISKDRS